MIGRTSAARLPATCQKGIPNTVCRFRIEQDDGQTGHWQTRAWRGSNVRVADNPGSTRKVNTGPFTREFATHSILT
jgi:hypothetical protein